MPRKYRVVDHIFGVDGANIEDLYDAAHFRSDLTAVLAKHEFSAATMAGGYSRSGAGTGAGPGTGLGVVAATSGGGALNLVAGLGESLTSRVPVLALVGQAPTAMDGLGSFQDTSGRNGSLNAEAVFSAVSLSCERAYGLAGLRIGYGVAAAELARVLWTQQLPFGVASNGLLPSRPRTKPKTNCCKGSG